MKTTAHTADLTREDAPICCGCQFPADDCACDEIDAEFYDDPAYIAADKADRDALGMMDR